MPFFFGGSFVKAKTGLLGNQVLSSGFRLSKALKSFAAQLRCVNESTLLPPNTIPGWGMPGPFFCGLEFHSIDDALP